ncbi:cell cycle control protein [Purpureocillium lavendulum]|uniref:Cell cycle control protein n=1 Tax=Purpureocillium lavendulum TaxID=1247861 RepID=A0AB34G783_9HYPO|nr:cell cycle control protein [Purpureocillium lavendulum]
MAPPHVKEGRMGGKPERGTPKQPTSLPGWTQHHPPVIETKTHPELEPKFPFMASEYKESYESQIEAIDSIAQGLGMGKIKSKKQYYLNRIKKKGRPKYWKDPHRTDEELAESMELIRRSGLNTAEVLRMSLPAYIRPPMPDYNENFGRSEDEDDEDDEDEERPTQEKREPRQSNRQAEAKSQ